MKRFLETIVGGLFDITIPVDFTRKVGDRHPFYVMVVEMLEMVRRMVILAHEQFLSLIHI